MNCIERIEEIVILGGIVWHGASVCMEVDCQIEIACTEASKPAALSNFLESSISSLSFPSMASVFASFHDSIEPRDLQVEPDS